MEDLLTLSSININANIVLLEEFYSKLDTNSNESLYTAIESLKQVFFRFFNKLLNQLKYFRFF